jgi:hypothetical protein
LNDYVVRDRASMNALKKMEIRPSPDKCTSHIVYGVI